MSTPVSRLRLGAHVDQADPIAEATARGADRAQFFLGDPQLESIARLWEALDARVDMSMIGLSLDTCHAHAGGQDLVGIVDRVKAITGKVDLVHANDSRDAFDSGADRHANIGSGSIDPVAILAVVAAAGAPVVCETPGGVEGQGGDIAFLRAHLPA